MFNYFIQVITFLISYPTEITLKVNVLNENASTIEDLWKLYRARANNGNRAHSLSASTLQTECVMSMNHTNVKALQNQLGSSYCLRCTYFSRPQSLSIIQHTTSMFCHCLKTTARYKRQLVAFSPRVSW